MIHSAFCRSVALYVAVVAGALTGCAQQPEKPSAEPIATMAKREKLALGLQEKGELAEALVQWNILSTIEPANDFYRKQGDADRAAYRRQMQSAHARRGSKPEPGSARCGKTLLFEGACA